MEIAQKRNYLIEITSMNEINFPYEFIEIPSEAS